MRIVASTRDGCTVLSLHGRLGIAEAPEVMRVLRKRLSERPWAIICDLSGIEAIDRTCAGVFLSVVNEVGGGWPVTGLLLCGANPPVTDVLGGLRVQRFLPLHENLDAALDRAFDRPVYLRDETHLVPTVNAPALARQFVREVCDYWRLVDLQRAPPSRDTGELSLTERVELVTSELVTNATLHARTAMRLRVELRGERLWVSVRDATPRLLGLVHPDPEGEGGRGLALVEALASSWGIRPDGDDGKVVWTSFRLDEPRSGRPDLN